MSTYFRALCAELTEELHGYASANPHHDSDELVARARAALAEPEPLADAGEVAELIMWLRWHGTGGSGRIDGTPWTASQLTRAADLLERLAPQPVSEGPSDEELLELSQFCCVSYLLSDGTVVSPFEEGTDMRSDVLSFARAVLARWGRP